MQFGDTQLQYGETHPHIVNKFVFPFSFDLRLHLLSESQLVHSHKRISSSM
jgi:hypothetical protein